MDHKKSFCFTTRLYYLLNYEQICTRNSEVAKPENGTMASGENFLRLTFDRLEVGELNELVAHESCGAVALFVGTTRDNFEGKEVVLLQYEAYEAMALKSMNAICEELRNRWPELVHIGIHHRLGTVPVKEASVVIAISSPHREAALEAVRWAIDELKKSVPVWKKEQYAEGQGCSEWKENKECTWSKAYKEKHIL